MKPTHQSIGCAHPVTAWQFSHTAPIPVWVARKFHRIEKTGWQGLGSKGELVLAKPLDWAVLADSTIIVLTDSEFQMLFKPI